jgi:hypothetical protein
MEMAETKHLWEVEHAYYCNEGNYYARESVESSYRSWADFLAENGDADMDYNLLFRWDWQERDDETGEPNFNGDVNYRNGTLLLFWLGQRKGLYRYSTVSVCRADEPAVLDYLRPRWEHLRSLWEPVSASSSEGKGGGNG